MAMQYYRAYGPRWDDFKDTADIPPVVQLHLKRVYLSLTACLLFASAGALFDLQSPFKIPPLLTVLLAIAALFYFNSLPAHTTPKNKRLAVLLSFAFLNGIALGPLVELISAFNQAVVLQALGATTIIFACFSIAALLAKRRKYLFLGGLLSSAVSVMAWLGLFSLFVPSSLNYAVQLYGGLIVFSGYVVYDTQKMVEKAHDGVRDPLKDTFDLMVNFLALFKRILIIMAENSAKREERKKRREQ